MKQILVLMLLLAVGTYASAQALDTVTIVSKARKFEPREHILLMFELQDTVDAAGKRVKMNRAYYFDKKTRTISSVREYDNPRKPEKGRQVIYSFGANKLASVTVIPPRSSCRNCAARYFYTNDSLVSKQGDGNANVNTALFIQQAHHFQSKMPADLPWGKFDNEVIVNGVKKKIKNPW